ncbi:MAG: hypothetical protein VZR78_01585, partial [Candidatus Enteromonas sp.]|nr:hypothetical protein [Candidatus Enteromonas sp.]
EITKLLEANPSFKKGCKNQEFVLRTLTYYDITRRLLAGEFKDISAYQNKMMANYMEEANKNTIDFEGHMKLLLESIKGINDADTLLIKAFRRGEENGLSGKIHPVTAESVIIAMMMGKRLPQNSESLLEFKKSLREMGDGRSPFYSSTRDPKNVIARYNKLCEVME